MRRSESPLILKFIVSVVIVHNFVDHKVVN